MRLHAASVNPFDCKIAAGMVKDWFPITFPYVPGMDGAGEVVAVGNGVEGWNEGDAVLAMFRGGAFAEYAQVRATNKAMARKPPSLDYEHAAAIPEVGLTALTMIRAAEIRAGQTALIVGATGGIGLVALQLARAEGARVIATGKAEDLEFLRACGADDVIDYTAGDTFTQVRQRYPKGVDVVLDVVAAGKALLKDAEVLREGGILVSSLGGPDQDAFPNGIKVRYIQMSAQPGDLDYLARLAADGALRIEIARTYDLADAPQALADLMDPAKHTRGKLMLRIHK